MNKKLYEYLNKHLHCLDYLNIDIGIHKITREPYPMARAYQGYVCLGNKMRVECHLPNIKINVINNT